MAADLSGARVLVVGSSTGIGRRIAIEAVGAGASVAFSARSRDKLESAVAEAGGGVVVVGDVRKPDDCTRIVDEAVAAIGGLDLVVFATGVSPLMPMEETPAETMHDVFETNAIGGLMLLTAAAGRLAEGGIVAYLGSDSVGRCVPGHGALRGVEGRARPGRRRSAHGVPGDAVPAHRGRPDRGHRHRARLRPGDRGADAPADAAVRPGHGEVHDRDAIWGS